jgi:hypothetical protein
VTVEERAPLIGTPEEAVMHAFGGQRRRERQVTASQSLAQAEEVGRNALLLAGEHRPGAPEPGRDLVADQEDVVPIAQLAHTP